MNDGASRRSMHQHSAFDLWMRNASNTSRFADAAAMTRRPQPTLAAEPTDSGMGSGAVFSGNASQAMLNTMQVCTPSARLSAVVSKLSAYHLWNGQARQPEKRAALDLWVCHAIIQLFSFLALCPSAVSVARIGIEVPVHQVSRQNGVHVRREHWGCQ
jgi:hypothetical protein